MALRMITNGLQGGKMYQYVTQKKKKKNASQLRENKSKNESCMVVFVPHVYDIMFEINNETVQLTVAATD